MLHVQQSTVDEVLQFSWFYGEVVCPGKYKGAIQGELMNDFFKKHLQMRSAVGKPALVSCSLFSD